MYIPRHPRLDLVHMGGRLGYRNGFTLLPHPPPALPAMPKRPTCVGLDRPPTPTRPPCRYHTAPPK